MGDDAAVAPHADLAIKVHRAVGGARLSRGSYEAAIELIGITMLALILRVLFLGKESLWWDEAESVRIAGVSWRHLADILWNGQANMSFYYALLHLWLGLGRSEFTLRALSVVVAVITIPVCYRLAARLFGRRVGLLAALLLALNVYHLRYSQEARSYALVVLLVTLASLCFVSAIRRPSWAAWGLYTGAVVLGVYSHFFVVFVLIAHWISLVFLPWRDVPWRSVVISTGAIGTLLSPLVLFVLTNDRGQIDWISHVPPDFVARSFTYLAGGISATGFPVADTLFRVSEVGRRVLWGLYAVFVTVALAGGGRLWLRTRTSPETWGYGFLLTWLVAPPILAYLVSFVKPMFIFYYLIVSLPPLAVLAADGLSRIRSTAISAGVLIVFASLTALHIAAHYSFGGKEDWRGLTAYVLSHAQPGDGLVFANTGSLAAFEYYRERLHRTPSVPPSILSPLDVQRDHPRRMWLVIAHSPGTSRAQSALTGRYVLVEDTPFYDGLSALLYLSVDAR